MRVASYRDAVLWPAFSKMGYDPKVDLLGDTADACSRSINTWVRKSWDPFDWPELSKTEPRNPVNHLIPYDAGVQPPPNWDNTTVFNKDSIVRDPNNLLNIYDSLVNANQNHPLSDNTKWFPVPAWNPKTIYVANNLVSDPVSGIVYVAQQAITPGTVLADSLRNPAAWLPLYSQLQPVPTITNIGRILKVYPVDPTMNPGLIDIPFREYDAAFHVGFRHGTTVWVKFMTRPSQYTATVYSASSTYQVYAFTQSISDLVFDPNTGEVFASLTANNHGNVLPGGRGNTVNWGWVPFPAVFAEVVQRGLYSDLLRDEGQLATAAAEEQAAMNELQLAIQRNSLDRYDRLTDQQTGVPRYGAMVGTGAS